MNTNRKTAIIVGVLFIIGTVAGILSVVFTSLYSKCSGLSYEDFCK